MLDPRIRNLAKILVNYSTRVQPGDKVMIWGFPLQPVAAPLVLELYRAVLQAGGHPYTYMTLPGQRELLLTEGSDEQLIKDDPIVTTVLQDFDVDIRIGSPTNTHSLSTIDPSRIRTKGKANRKDWEYAGQRTAAGEYRWVASRYPTQGLAQAAEMSLAAYEDFLFRATYADTEDPVAHWQAFHDRQEILINRLAGKSNVRVTGPEVDLTFSIQDRTFNNSSGRHNMPDGEIYTGPVEDSVNGWVRFSYPVIYGGHEVIGAELKFENGKAVEATADKGEGFLNSMLDSDPGARYVGEFAIGTNWEIQKPTRNMLFDEKIGGTIHMAMGAGYPETGSVNKSAIHWDMLCDMRDGGQIFVDDELFYDSGEFIE